MHWKKARAEGLTDKAMGKRKRPEACSIGESHTYPRSSAGGSKERVVQERNWGDEPGDPPPRCGSRRCPCPQLPQPHSALETFPPMLSRLEHRLLEIRNLGFDWGTISQSKGHRGKPFLPSGYSGSMERTCTLESGKFGFQPRLFYLLPL